MHHKKHRPKNRRAGCLMCKMHKMNGWSKDSLQVSKTGFSSLRKRLFAKLDIKEEKE
jgi:hypothetical protein